MTNTPSPIPEWNSPFVEWAIYHVDAGNENSARTCAMIAIAQELKRIADYLDSKPKPGVRPA